jgi:hypothetical protein
MFKEFHKAFVLLPKNIFKKLPLTSINMHCKSLVEKYSNKDMILNSIMILKHVKFVNVL